jgi:hypothetical protein
MTEGIATTVGTFRACQIAGIDRDRFNEAIHAGTYTCAPLTTPGKERRFAIADVAALCVYSGLNVALGIPLNKAGYKAHEFRELLEQHPEAKTLAIPPSYERSLQFIEAKPIVIDVVALLRQIEGELSDAMGSSR